MHVFENVCSEKTHEELKWTPSEINAAVVRQRHLVDNYSITTKSSNKYRSRIVLFYGTLAGKVFIFIFILNKIQVQTFMAYFYYNKYSDMGKRKKRVS